jgi:Protein of unknown function (DUF3592)
VIAFLGLGVAAAVPFFILGLGIWGLQRVAHARALLEPIPGGIQASGTVVGSQHPCDLGCDYTAVVRYTDRSGRAHTFTVPYQNENPVIGSTVKVSYDPEVPADAHDISRSPSTHDDVRLGAFIFVTAVGGLTVLGAGAVVVVTVVRSRARAKVLPQRHGD